MVSSPRKGAKQKKNSSAESIPTRSNLINQPASSADEAMSESSNHGATTSHNSNKSKKAPTLPSIDDKFQFLRKGVSKKGNETLIFKCLIPDCNNRVII